MSLTDDGSRTFSAPQTGLRGFVTASQAVSAVEFVLICNGYIGGLQVATGMAVHSSNGRWGGARNTTSTRQR